MSLPFGKIPIEILEKVVFKNLGVKRKEVVLGPTAGIDGAVIDTEDKSLVISMDPITGALDRIGWLAINVNANDVATFGVPPTLFFSCILLPESADRKAVALISVEMNRAAKKLGMAIAGGHCEVTPGIVHPIVVGCAMGMTEKGNYVTAGGAKPKDKLILTKSVGIEGTAILATDKERLLRKALKPSMLQNAKKLYTRISVVEDALTAFQTGGVNAMHDPTEGGLAGGVHEMADASKLGVKIVEEKIRLQPETNKICEFFRIDPLQLISSGALLISAKPESADRIIDALRQKRIHASIIGEFLENTRHRLIVGKNGETKVLPRPVSDHLWLALLGKVPEFFPKT